MKINNRQQVFAIAAAALVGFFVLDKIVITPLTASWNERSAAIKELRGQIAKGTDTLKLERNIRAKWTNMRTNSFSLDASQAEQELIMAFDKWSQESRITVTSIKPQWKRGTTDDYSLLECRLDASGSLGMLTQFLYAVEHSPLAIKIESVEIQSRDTTGQQLVLGLLVSGLRLAPMEGK